MGSHGLLELLTGPAAVKIAGLLGSTAVVFGVQRLVPTFDPSWYKSLRKPNWTPPNYVFPMVWIPLKLMQSVALWLVCTKAPTAGAMALPLAAFGAHMFLGNWWNAAAFHPVSPAAAFLMLPTQVWVTIATKLNYDIVKLNT
ncbi:hypothetical protein VOLCADRAFT_87048 [Volvox carteri f. nagariensis]|uniref:TspO/MBR-related protein n=1 Tax=Volvox carteri f. nagariensis TaxID=3068 RepID=D8TK14_VOLCA|nr:uncharacterized protein VOLCADRAFT_87048 [Volvox carteri f. nagariensis]EFJ52168.1 hypothetical protein VOLCADRAFT_87048 [Volvox carteri f. nagariensis]|eukprot:XP_002946942.1 hypothetical protein VOLCADRAFT_87048 [Volvox carteri f. nagariensis]